MASPNYANQAVKSSRIGRQLMRTACKLADLVFKHIQQSNYAQGVKDAAATWQTATSVFCAVVEAAWDALPDGP